MQNSFPMREWHVKNMEKTIIKHVKGLSPDATKFERRMYKRYGGIHKVQMRIKYDIKHGVNNEEVILFLQKIRTGMEFTDLLKSDGSLDRLNEIESYFI
ncbi:MAG TPA: hypothetical protein VFC05_02420 [Nitrososphaeraceae archaeon]|jgi:hypothetical protein|nr:hypothetical protein [Nitrososphaeraceae archaeon]HZL22150.1 hypothetical protein [Nitrososphaeraceae archaeon]